MFFACVPLSFALRVVSQSLFTALALDTEHAPTLALVLWHTHTHAYTSIAAHLSPFLQLAARAPSFSACTHSSNSLSSSRPVLLRPARAQLRAQPQPKGRGAGGNDRAARARRERAVAAKHTHTKRRRTRTEHNLRQDGARPGVPAQEAMAPRARAKHGGGALVFFCFVVCCACLWRLRRCDVER